jgi:hypothetical protein
VTFRRGFREIRLRTKPGNQFDEIREPLINVANSLVACFQSFSSDTPHSRCRINRHTA